MYDVIKFIWELDVFKTKLNELAIQAERVIESEQPPLFLRIILTCLFTIQYSSLKQIQEKEGEREAGCLLHQLREQKHMGQLARYHNLMEGETIGVTEILTSSIQQLLPTPP